MGTVDLLTALVLALSPLAGYVLGRFVKEELAPGRKWFLLAKRVLFVAIAAVFLYAHKWQLWPMVIGLTVVFAYLAFKPFRMWWYVQALLAIAFVMVAATPFSFLITALIFLYGLPTGSVLAQKKALKESLFAGAVFFAAVLVAQYLL
jgi:hypothetical protein